MRGFVSRSLALAAAFILAAQPVIADEAMISAGADRQPLNQQAGFERANLPLLGAGGNAAGGGAVAGDPTGLVITSGTWTSNSDFTPVSQNVDGWTGDLTLNATAPAGAFSAYNFGAGAGVANGAGTSARLTFPVTRPGYNSSGGAITLSPETVYADWSLRQTYANGTLPSEAANGGNAKIAVAFNTMVHAADTVGTATTLSALYTSGAVTSTAKGSIPVTNNSTQVYPRPIGAWVTPPAERVGSTGNFTAEFFGGQSFAQGGVPLAAVIFTFCDASCTHSFTKTVSTPTVSVRQPQTTCTGTNGSAVLTGCGDTSRFMAGQRLTVIGIPGQPSILSKTSSTLTLGSAQTCVTTLNSGNITVNGTPGDGQALADGGFAGATLSDVNITAPVGVATITSETLTADITSAAQQATAAVVHTNATGVTATAAHACTINHVFQGSTGSVTVTLGNPVPVYAAVASPTDFTNAGFVDGPAYVRAQAYPSVGNVILDTQTGADGTGCDWWYGNVAGVCSAIPANCTSAACFQTNGQDISPNLHNLWFYYDHNDKYAPAYAWVKPGVGTCVTAACVSLSPTDPGGAASNYATSVQQAQANIKLWYNANKAHNDPQGGVMCLTAGTYAGFGAGLHTNTVGLLPPQIVTSALLGGDCPASGSANSDVSNVVLTHTATANANAAGVNTRFNNVKVSDTLSAIVAFEGLLTTAFNSVGMVFNDDWFVPTASSALLLKVGVRYLYGGLVNEVGGEGRVLEPSSTATESQAMVFASTLFCGAYTSTSSRIWQNFNGLGVIGYNCTAASPVSVTTQPSATQYLSATLAYTKLMGSNSSPTNILNAHSYLFSHLIMELIGTNTTPALQVSADSANVPITNVWRSYSTISGGRSNIDYNEGVPVVAIAVGAGGAFAAGNYYFQVVYALASNPTVESSTDGVAKAVSGAGTFTTTAVVLNGSLSVTLPCDPNYVAYLYVDSALTNPTGGNTAFAGHYGIVGGVDAKALPMCATYTVTNVGSAHSALAVATSPAHAVIKTAVYEQFNLDENYNNKSDYFGSTTSQAGSFASGGKVSNWSFRFKVRHIGNIAATGTAIGGGFDSASGLGEFAGLNDSGGSGSATDITQVKYKSDRSFGGGGTSTPTTPALDLGHGNYCLDVTSTQGRAVVPSGLASWPWDIQGRTRLNDGTGYAGAYEKGCT